jgi:uncharacterized protein (TIGR02145 family)
MKKITLLCLLLAAVNLFAQTYEISFAATGDTNVVDSVLVENLTCDTSLVLKGDDILTINIIEDVNGIETDRSQQYLLHIYPNPAREKAFVEFSTTCEGNVEAMVYDLSGRKLVHSSESLSPGEHTYSITGLPKGIYLVSIFSEGTYTSAKLISQSVTKGKPSITRIGSSNSFSSGFENGNLKSAKTTIDLPCKEGDRLKFTGMTGNYRTIVMGMPEGNSTITFDLMDCTDADDNHYPVVTIGSRTWMAENLKTTRYNDSTSIPTERVDSLWGPLGSPAYAWYDNDSLSYKDTYGALYNWYAVNTTTNGDKNVCPAGWHVATYTEMYSMINSLGSTAGGKLKETGTENWNSPNNGANNLTGFTARGGGWRPGTGEFMHMKVYGCWWTSTGQDAEQAIYLELGYSSSSAATYPWYKKCGFSVRCVRDDE